MKISVFWDFAPCSLIHADSRFRRAYCLHHQEAVNSSETYVNIHQTTWCNIQKTAILTHEYTELYNWPWKKIFWHFILCLNLPTIFSSLSSVVLKMCTVFFHHSLHQCLSNCGPRPFARRSAGGFGSKNITKVVSDTERVQKTHLHVCVKTAFVGWPSTEYRRIRSSHKFLMVSLTTGVMFSYSFSCTFKVQGILRRCAPKWSAIVESWEALLYTLNALLEKGVDWRQARSR
jgi:hypothetical protein